MRRSPYFLLSGCVLGLDRLSKWLVLRSFLPGESVPVIDGVLRLTRVHNAGGAFGLFPNHRGAFVALSAAVAAGLFAALLFGWLPGRLVRSGASLLLAGAVGNLVDRLSYGFVLDFVELPHFPVFNIADSAIVLGALLMAIGIFWREREATVRSA